MLLAVLEKRVGFKLIQKDVFVNIAGGMKINDLAMDLSIIAAVLSSNVDTPIETGVAMCGEVGLSGEVRPVSHIEQRIAEAETRILKHHHTETQYERQQPLEVQDRNHTCKKSRGSSQSLVWIKTHPNPP